MTSASVFACRFDVASVVVQARVDALAPVAEDGCAHG